MMDLDATLVAQMINFLLLFAILNAILFRPVHRNIEARRRFFAEGQKKIADSLAKIQEMQRKYQRMLDKARQQAQSTIDATIRQAEQERRQQVRAVLEERRKQMEQALAQLKAEKEDVISRLGDDITAMAERIADKVMHTDDPRLQPVGGAR